MTAEKKKAEQAYDLLERMITFQELQPGSMVSESTLMQITGLGRHPIRAALQRLSWERMVDVHPRKGIIVARISVEAQLKLLAVRRTVEGMAVRWAAARATSEQKQTIRGLAGDLLVVAAGGDVPAFGQLLKRVHEVIVLAAQNEFLHQSMAPLQGLSRRFWFSNLVEVRADLEKAATLHAAILAAIANGDEKAAAAAAEQLNNYLTDFTYSVVQSAGK